MATAARAAEQGLTRIQSYRVNTTIASRFAQTTVNIDLVNERDCATILGLTLQLPLDARVTDLQILADNGCTWTGRVEALEEAIESFTDTASEGKPAALLSAWDSTNYAVQVSLPPLGNTTLVLVMEQLLRRQQHQVSFQIPLSPGVPVKEIIMDLLISEPESGVAEFDLDTPALGSMNIDRQVNTASAHYQVQDISDGDVLPRLLRGHYDPGPLPENGLLRSDGSCFMHLFNPASLLDTGPLSRNIVFVIDVSGSMDGRKLADAKAAFNAMIESLSGDDYFTVHSFSDDGIEGSWGPQLASAQAKDSATEFVSLLQTIGSTNLHDAYIQGIERALSTLEEGEYVSILMILTDGQATTGIQSSVDISRNVKSRNEGGRVKIFALAFGEGADLPLLLGISIQNGGLAVPIYEGYGDAVSQMEDFYNGEIGSVLLSDVNVELSSDSGFEAETQTSFPVLAAGSEIAVRGLLSESSESSQTSLRATTTGLSASGQNTWDSELELVQGDSGYDRECYQSFAHAKITEMWQYHDAAMSLGSELEGYITFSKTQKASNLRQNNLNLVERIEAESLSLALESGLVWPGLTAMVTGEPSCPSGAYDYSQSEELCYDGDAYDPTDIIPDDESAADGGSYGSPPASSPGGGSSGGGTDLTSGGAEYFVAFRLLLPVALSSLIAF